MLQWGRGFAATEGSAIGSRWFVTKSLQWGRGFAATEGAGRSIGRRSRSPASMGPWLRSHGRASTGLSPRCRYPLQWGRGFAATEGQHGRRAHQGPVGASMGPWLRSHGRRRCLRSQFGLHLASMGPWLRSHGRSGADIDIPRTIGLQWGRGFAATEGKAARCFVATWRGFNGAVASQPRKGNPSRRADGHVHELQWGRGFAATEGS